MITIILALDKHGGIGKNNDLPWRLKDDLAHFKRVTLGHTVVMGSNTFRSLPNGELPHRVNMVVTSGILDKVRTIHSLCDIPKDCFIIGGAALIKSTLHLADRLILTHVDAVVDADTFVSIDYTEWQEVSSVEYSANERNEFNFRVVEYVRTRK